MEAMHMPEVVEKGVSHRATRPEKGKGYLLQPSGSVLEQLPLARSFLFVRP